MIRFNVQTKEGMEAYKFDTVSEAYFYYLDHFATKNDFLYYEKTASESLFNILDERLMCMMFRNVFENCVYFDGEVI